MTILDIFLEIVQIDSETGNKNEKSMSEYIQQFLSARNIMFTVDEHFQIHASINNEKKEWICFCAHMDTVAPGKNIIPKVHSDGKITSSGNTILGADNKASLASMLWMIEEIIQKKCVPAHNLEFLFTAEEEGDFPKIYTIPEKNIRSKTVFIFDKANEEHINTVVSKAGYLTCFDIIFTGKGAHSSKPELAQNVLQMFLKFCTHLPFGKDKDGATFNIGTVQAGEAPNTVPAQLKASGDFRGFSEETMNSFENILHATKTKILAEPKWKDCSIEIILMPYCKGYTHDTKSESFTRLEKCYKKIGYSELQKVETQSGSDASYFMNLQNPIPAYCLGDGCFAIHTVHEYTTTTNLEKLGNIMKNIAENF